MFRCMCAFFVFLMMFSSCGFDGELQEKGRFISLSQSDEDEDTPTEPDGDGDEPQGETSMERCEQHCESFCSPTLGGCKRTVNYAYDMQGYLYCTFYCNIGGIQRTRHPPKRGKTPKLR